MTDEFNPSRRGALQCLPLAARHTFHFVGRHPDADRVGTGRNGKAAGLPLFLQISDTHIGFNKMPIRTSPARSKETSPW